MPILVVLLLAVPMLFGAESECFERSLMISGKQAVVVLKVDRAVQSKDAFLLESAQSNSRYYGAGSVIREAMLSVILDKKPVTKSSVLICEMRPARITAKGEEVTELGGKALQDIPAKVVPMACEKNGRWRFSFTVDTKDFRDRESEELIGELDYQVTSLLVAKLRGAGGQEAVEIFRFHVTQALSGIELEPLESTKVSCSR